MALILLLLIFFFTLSCNTTRESSSAAAAAAGTQVCPVDWKLAPNNTNKCFIHIPTPQTWLKSQSICKTLHNHSHLAVPSSSSHHQQLSLLQTLCHNASSCWLGGSTTSNSSSPSTWLWLDSDSTVSSNLNHTHSCALLTHRYNSSSLILPATCNSPHHFICMLRLDNTCHGRRCRNRKEYFIILSSVSGLILCTTFALVIWLLVYKRTKRRKRSRSKTTSNPSTSALVTPSWKVFTNEELRSITKNFSEGNRLIGDAKTGGTYSGLLPDGSRVAVKRLKRSSFQRKKEFYSAIGRVARLHHPNLVTIRGCRYDHGDRYIVYDFVANGPLDRWLHHIPRGGRSLDWSMRITIATTLAQGIAFLHDKVKPHVVHQDIRACNVLLDEDFGAHLMGVGLSKFVPWEVMHERTVMAASYGYLAPEFVYRNELTTKSDVYSFGVLLLEIVSGRRPTQSVDSVGGWQSIFEWATPLVQSHCYLDLLDPLISDLPELGVIQKVVDLVYACTQHVPSVRPRMSHVVHQLQQLGLKAASEKTTSSSTSTSTATPLSAMEYA